MTTSLSEDIGKKLMDVIKISLSFKPEERGPKLDKFSSLLDEVFYTLRKKAEETIDRRNFREAAEMYYLTSKITDHLAKAMKNTEIKGILADRSQGWLLHANSMFGFTISSLLDEARKLEKINKHEEASVLKNQASILEYEIKNQIMSERFDQEASNFIRHSRQVMQMEEQSKSVKSYIEQVLKRSKNFSKSDTSTDYFGGPEPSLKAEVDAGDKLQIGQYASREIDGWYDWSVYVEPVGNSKVLDKIKSVKYYLHPTFPDPKPITDPKNKFMLNATGWGEFEIKADITFKDGNTITKYHWLKLSDSSSTVKSIG